MLKTVNKKFNELIVKEREHSLHAISEAERTRIRPISGAAPSGIGQSPSAKSFASLSRDEFENWIEKEGFSEIVLVCREKNLNALKLNDPDLSDNDLKELGLFLDSSLYRRRFLTCVKTAIKDGVSFDSSSKGSTAAGNNSSLVADVEAQNGRTARDNPQSSSPKPVVEDQHSSVIDVRKSIEDVFDDVPLTFIFWSLFFAIQSCTIGIFASTWLQRLDENADTSTDKTDIIFIDSF